MTLQSVMDRANMRRCPSDMEMDLYFLNEKPSKDDTFTQHIEACDICKARWETHRRECEEFETKVFPQTVSSVVNRVLKEQGSATLLHFIKPSAALCALAASALIVFGLSFSSQFFIRTETKEPLLNASTPYIGEKGALGMEVWCRRANRVFRINEGDTLYPNDMIRFVPRFPEGKSRYAMVVSRDTFGKTSQYAPLEGRAVLVSSGEAFEGSIVLDDALGEEDLFLLAAPRPFDIEEARDAISPSPRRTTALHASGSLKKTRLTVYKTATFEPR